MAVQKKLKLSIIYPNYNTQELLEDSLRSVKQQLGDIALEVLVVDNASKSFSESALQKIMPVTVFKQSKNLGFGGANNVAADKARGEYLWLLNTDTIVPTDNHIQELLDWLDAHSHYAAACPLLTNAEGAVQPAQVDELPRLSDIIVRGPERRSAKYVAQPRSQDVGQAVAAALVVRRSAFKAVGGFDSRYFMYYEDTDLCAALTSAGGKIRWYTESHIIHLWGKSLSSSSQRKRYYYESQTKYFKKWHGWLAAASLQLVRAPLYVKNVWLGKS